MGFVQMAGYGAADQRKPNDFYPTPSVVTLALLRREKFPGVVWEPCAGEGDMVSTLKLAGYSVVSSELHSHCYDFTPDFSFVDLTCATSAPAPGVLSVVTNPPFTIAYPMIQNVVRLGIRKHAWLLRLQFWETAQRYQFFCDHPPARIHTFAERAQVSEKGLSKAKGGLICWSWWVWEQGNKEWPRMTLIGPGELE